MPLFHLFKFVKGNADFVFQSKNENKKQLVQFPWIKNLANGEVGIFNLSLHLSTTVH